MAYKTTFIVSLVGLLIVAFFLLLPQPLPIEPQKPVLYNSVDINQENIQAGLISDFNDTINNTQRGTGIFASTDQFANGHSVVNLSLKQGHSSHDKYLHVSGELKKGFIFRWSGMSLNLTTNRKTGVNLSDIHSISFEAKGGTNTKNVSIMLSQIEQMTPSEVKIELTNKWQTYTILLYDFPKADLTQILSVSLARTMALGKFEFMLDNLRFDN